MSPLKRKKILGLLLTCMLGLNVFAQMDGNFIDKSQDIYIPFTITHFGTKHGLPQNQILDIIPKKNGELILATANGIVEFNGFEFFDFIPNNAYKKSLHEKLIFDEVSKTLYGVEFGGKVNKISPSFELYLSMRDVQYDNGNLISLDNNGTIYSSKLGAKNLTPIVQTKIDNARTFLQDGNNYYVASDKSAYEISKNGKKRFCLRNLF